MFFHIHLGLTTPSNAQTEANKENEPDKANEKEGEASIPSNVQMKANKKNVPDDAKEKGSEASRSSSRDSFIGSVLNAENRLNVRPMHVRRPSQSFDAGALAKINEE